MKCQSANTNRTRMKLFFLSDVTIGCEEPAMSISHSYKTLTHTNHARASIDRWGHCDREFSLGEIKSGDKMSICFGWSTNNVIPMNLLRNIGSITPQIIGLDSGTGIRWNRGVEWNIIGRNSPRNIRSFGIFDIGTSDLSDRSASWHHASKSEREPL